MKKQAKNISILNKGIQKKVAPNIIAQKTFNFNWLYLILAFITFVIYVNTLSNGYSYNDELNVLSNPNLKNIQSVFSFPAHAGFFSTVNFPLTKFVFFIEYSVFGYHAIISHSLNLLFYIAAILSVFKLLKTHFLFQQIWLAFFVTALFSLHPIHTEVVNNIQNRGDILVFLFSILSMDLFLSAIENNQLRNNVFAMFFLLCGLLCSPFAIISILVVLVFILLFKRDKIRSVVFFSIMIALFLAVFYFIFTFNKISNTIYFVENPIVNYTSFIDKFSLIATSALMYFKLILLPVKLSFYYGYNTISINRFLVLAAIIFYLILVFYVIYFYKKNKLLSFFIFFYFISLLFYCSVFFPYPGIISERATLFASLPFCFLIVYLINSFAGDSKITALNRPAFWSVFLIICSLYSLRTIARNMDWKDTLTLMSNDIAHLENSANANYLYADQNILAYNADGNVDRKNIIEIALKKSLEIYPDYSLALSNLGYLYSVINNDTLKGLEYMQQAYKVDPENAKVVSNLALAYNKVANPDSAQSLFNKSIQLDSNNQLSYYYAAQSLFENGKQSEAFEKNADLCRKFPENELAYLNYGAFYFRLGKEDSSIANFELAVKYGSKNKQLINHLFSVFTKNGNMEKAAYYQSLLNDN